MAPSEAPGRPERAGARPGSLIVAGLLAAIATIGTPARGQGPHGPHDSFPFPPGWENVNLLAQSDADVSAKNGSCVSCHQNTGNPHRKDTVRLGCTDCHGGNPTSPIKEVAHVRPRFPEAWRSSANPVRSYTLLNKESPDFVRFVNPGDLRIAHISCGTSGCHGEIVGQARNSMMAHGAMLWGAALYNNGAVPHKRARFGEAYSMHGAPLRLQTVPPPTMEETKTKGILPYLDPLPKFEATQPGNVLRIFERGRINPQEIGLPNPGDPPGRPLVGLSNRGLGTKTRTDPVMLGLAKTRLFDPTTNFLGTNDHPGDYRSSGCSSCHVVYANDRSPVISGSYAKYGNMGLSFNPDPTIPKNEPGHPIKHEFVWAPPTSQCMICHIHPGTTVMNSYVGFMWWDEETDGELMYPEEQKDPTAEQLIASFMLNPDETAARGNWSNPAFVANLTNLNPKMKHTQFADFHGHGWAFRAVYKKDRRGNLLDADGDVIPDVTTEKLMAAMDPPSPMEKTTEGSKAYRDGVPLHLMDIHMEKGMHCVDCHFIISGHGNGKLYGEVRNAIEIQCIDCHGTTGKYTDLKTTGPASPEGGLDLAALRTPFGKRRFEWKGGQLYQNSMVEEGVSWRCVQTADTVRPGTRDYNQKSQLSKTVRFQGDQMVWGDLPGGDDRACAHANGKMTCISCHSSWNPSCYGCHLPQRANMKMPELHNAGDVSRNYISYNFQTLRDDVFMLARDGDVTGNRINPARSSCAIHVGSYNGNRESVYYQQQTISGGGFSGIAFSVNVPHTVRGGPPVDPHTGRALNPANYLPGRGETKQCTDCHVSTNNDNNAIMAQVLMQGTNYLNFIGRYTWIAAGEHGLHAATVTERDEPQTVIGSSLHRTAYPENFKEFCEEGRILESAHEHPGKDVIENLHPRYRKPEILGIQARGEYLYAACGANGLRVFDIAFIDDKAFSERITTAPVSPLGQRFYVRTEYATDVAAPATTAPDPTRVQSVRDANSEGAISLMYAFLYVADRVEGLVMVGAGTLLDGNPLNNFLKRDLQFNPGGILCGAKSITIFSHYAYMTCDAGLVVIDIADPTKPAITQVIGRDVLRGARAFEAQFRYGYACDEEGVKVFDMTDPAHPVPISALALDDARNIYLGRTYAYVAGGKHGLVLLDIEVPTSPRIDMVYNAGGAINDLNDVKLGITYVSQFAYLADGKNGMRIVQLTSPETPGNDGYSPRPTPHLIATYPIPEEGHALAIAEGIDRDRAVDEAGNQLSVFGRVGARPFNFEEQQKMYMRNGRVYTVTDDPNDFPFYSAPPPVAQPMEARKPAAAPARR